MNANRHHANRPSTLTAVDRARQAAALARHDAAIRRHIMGERIKAVAAWALVAVLSYTFGPAILAAAMGAANAFGG
jgi:hypothetical protein